MKKNITLGGKIKALRRMKGYSQSAFAHELDVSLSTYQRIEQDITDTTISTLEQISKVLKISVLDIFAYGTDYITENKYKKLFEEQQTEIRKLERELRAKDKEIITLQSKLLNSPTKKRGN